MVSALRLDGEACAGSSLPATLVFASEETTGQREVGEHTKRVSLATGEKLFLNGIFEHTVLGLHADQLLVPKPMTETWGPECPNRRYSISGSSQT
jgi:hypothetical protein